MMTTREPEVMTVRGMTVRGVLGWALLPALVLMQFFDLRRGVIGADWTWSAILIGFALVVLVGLPLVWGQLRELPRAAWIGLAAFTVLLLYAMVSVFISGDTTYLINRKTTDTAIPPMTVMQPQLEHRLVPLLTAWLTMVAAVVVVLLIPAAQRVSRLWWAGWVLVVTSLAVWPRAVLVHGSPRLATGMGGSATIHIVFLLCAGLFLGAAWQGHRRRWSLVGAASSVLCLLLTGSRAGLLALAVFAVLVLAWLGRRISTRIAGLVLVGIGGLGALLVAVVPAARHLVVVGDDLRQMNLATAWPIFTENWVHTIFGVGSGRLWPWYAFDARYLQVPYRGQVETSEGFVLTNPHSVPLGVAVELGLLGLAIFVVLVVVLVARLVRSWRARSGYGSVGDGLLLALVGGFAAFIFDFYLFKNFAVSFWWWVCFTAVFVLPRPESVGAGDPVAAERVKAGRVPSRIIPRRADAGAGSARPPRPAPG